MGALRRGAFGVVVIGQTGAVAGGDFQVAAHEVALGHAMGAHDAEAAVFVGGVEVGVEGQRGAGFVLQDRGLIVDDVAVGMEGVIDRVPDRFLDVEDLGLLVRGGGVGGDKGFPAAKAGDSAPGASR